MKKRYSKIQNNLVSYAGIPFVESYKYLGTLFTPKLKLKPAAKILFDSLSKTKNFLQPILQKADAKCRWYLWRIFAESKIKACSILYCFETSATSRNWFINKLKGSLKAFLGLKVTINDEWADWLFDLENEKFRLGAYFDSTIIKWSIRNGQPISLCSRQSSFHKFELCKFISPKVIELINLFTIQCPLCSKVRLFPNHIQKHNLSCPSIQSIIREIDETLSMLNARKLKITEITAEIGEKYSQKLRDLLKSLYVN